MRLVQVSFLYLSSMPIMFLILEAAALGVASEYKRRSGAWKLGRVRRNVKSLIKPKTQGDAVEYEFVRAEDVKDSLYPRPSFDAHIRVKRYRQMIGCRLGTCTLQNLAHQIYQLTDKGKDNVAPTNQISSTGYGRRKRSVPENTTTFQLFGNKLKQLWLRTRNSRKSPKGGQESYSSPAPSEQKVLGSQRPWARSLRT
ncbi:adrenomedullin a [Latimeria chalumnae]|nr:PREDICTED: ADM [Latimeria chalumnae]|eukprot:XP_005989751.1 PREDICTED: ADM [Latimeria chalumnae]